MDMDSMVSILLAQADSVSTIGRLVNEIGIPAAIIAVILYAGIYLLPVYRDNLKKKGEALDNLSTASVNLVRLSEAHKERIDRVDDELSKHHDASQLCGKVIGEHYVTNKRIAMVACKAIRQFLNDDAFPTDKQKYLMYVEEIESMVQSNGKV